MIPQAPEAAQLDGEMKAFLDWFNTNAGIDPVLIAGLAHLWFVTIHPFDDGNGGIGRAIDGAQTTLGAVLAKARFWESVAGFAINDRQRLVLNRLLDGFEGKLTTSKYAKLAKCSHDTALRDILPLVERGILVRNPEGGRSTSYALAAEHWL